MEIYFNPYPGSALNESDGIQCAVKAANAFSRLKKTLGKMSLPGKFADIDAEVSPANFVLVRAQGIDLGLKDIFSKISSPEREYLRLLLQTFSRGQVIDTKEFDKFENWIVTNVNAPAPILALAAKNRAIALTIPTEQEWRVGVLFFSEQREDPEHNNIFYENKKEVLHNLWGQDDVSAITQHCIESIENSTSRFAARFDAVYCPGALNDAPDSKCWESFGFFQKMERAKERNFTVDDDLLKSVGDTKCGALLELRVYGPGFRIFFVRGTGLSPEILIGGFYKKGTGDDKKAQNKAIQTAKARIETYVP